MIISSLILVDDKIASKIAAELPLVIIILSGSIFKLKLVL